MTTRPDHASVSIHCDVEDIHVESIIFTMHETLVIRTAQTEVRFILAREDDEPGEEKLMQFMEKIRTHETRESFNKRKETNE